MYTRLKNWLGAGLFLLLALIPLGAGAIDEKTLTTALKSNEAPITIKLDSKVDVENQLCINKDVTIDLNGYELSGNQKYFIEIESNGHLTVTDSSADQKGTITSATTTSSAYTIHFASKTNNNSLTVTGGTIKAPASDKSGAILGNPSQNSKITISGGTISGKFSLQISFLTITGGKIDGELLMNKGASATIGSVGGNCDSLSISTLTAGLGTLTLNSGTIGNLSQNGKASPPTISQAAVNNADVFRVKTLGKSHPLPNRYEYRETENRDYFYIAPDSNQVAMIGSEPYSDLELALTYLKDGETLTLLHDAGDIKTSKKNITLDLNGYTVTGNVTINQPEDTGANTVAIKNGTVTGSISANQNRTGPVTLDLDLPTPPPESLPAHQRAHGRHG